MNVSFSKKKYLRKAICLGASQNLSRKYKLGNKAKEKEIFMEYMQSFLSVKIFNGSLVFTVNI